MSRLTGHEQPSGPNAAAELRLTLLGRRVAVQTADRGLVRSSRALWSRCLDRAAPSPSDLVVATLPGDTDASLMARIVGTVCDASAARFLTVRASAVADEHGQVVALLSADTSARTDAVQHLAGHGFSYVSGSVLAVEPDGAVTPLPGPLHAVRAADDGARDRALFSPDELRLRPCPDRLRLARLIILDRRPDEPAPHLVREDLLETLQAITPLITPAAAKELPLRRLCRTIDRAGGVHRLSYADIGQAAPLLGDLLASAPPEEREPWEPLALPRDTLDSVGWRIMDGRIHRAPYRDAIRIDAEALVSSASVPTRLGPLGLTIWELAEDAPTLAELVDRVVDQHGSHPEAEALVIQAVTSMVDAGVLGNDRPRHLDEVLGAFRASGHAGADAVN
jgi:hypothetical protein